jgi:hypothetical protein
MNDQFDISAGKAGKADGMDRAERSADPYWWACMLEAGKIVAQRKPYFFTDDLVRHCRDNHPNTFTHENRAIGPLMRELCRLEYCIPTQDWIESAQKQCHRRPMRVWFSLIYRGRSVPKPRKRKLHDPRQYDLGL